MPLLFSYGTLQDETVQQTLIGRTLEGAPDEIVGCEQSSVPIEANRVAAAGRAHNVNLIFTGDAAQRVAGTAFEVTDADLAFFDAYEAEDDYRRVQKRLASGREAWVYVYAP
jgi:gamma-glutamylcyclotransferase (GGCT)/AIG2-like uncharacterized protein YtfP